MTSDAPVGDELRQLGDPAQLQRLKRSVRDARLVKQDLRIEEPLEAKRTAAVEIHAELGREVLGAFDALHVARRLQRQDTGAAQR